MISAGYDNAISVSEIDGSDITIVEAYAENNLQSLLKDSKIYSLTLSHLRFAGTQKVTH